MHVSQAASLSFEIKRLSDSGDVAEFEVGDFTPVLYLLKSRFCMKCLHVYFVLRLIEPHDRRRDEFAVVLGPVVRFLERFECDEYRAGI